MRNLYWIHLLGLMASGVLSEEVVDVKETEDATLRCRFNPVLISTDTLLYWSRTNNREKDNVAIKETPLEGNYRVDFRGDEGRYDLYISSALYDRDNGDFECKVVEGGTGRDLHTQVVRLTVLLEPGPPQVTPTGATATEGKKSELTCRSVGGSPDPQIKWYRKGFNTPLNSVTSPGGSRDKATSSVLTLTPERGDDGAEFECVVWNRAMPQGQRHSTTVSLSVNYYPRVTVGPENPLRVEKGQSATLTCQVDAKPPVSNVRWTRNGRFINTRFSHTLTSVSTQDAGSYACTADNGLGQVGDAQLTLDVLYGPEVTVESRREVGHGQDVSVRCNVSANPPPVQIEWLKDEEPSFRQVGQFLTLRRVTADDNGVYTCRAVNQIQSFGSGSLVEKVGNATTAILIQHAPGKAIITPRNPVAIEGKNMTLFCKASPPGWPTPTYRWRRQGSDAVYSQGANLIIPVARLENEGTYRCEAENDVGKSLPDTVELAVHQPPRFITQLEASVQRRVSDPNLSVVCSARGKPKPFIRWLKNGEEINTSSGLYEASIEESQTRSGAFTVQSTLKFIGRSRLKTNQLMPTDRGRYTCQFENDVQEVTSTMLLRIEHSPIVVHQANKVAYDLGEMAFITCKMQAYPAPAFTWTYKNAIITKDGLMYDTNTTDLGDDIHETTLKIVSVRESDYGDYICKGLNTMGEHKTIIKLQPKGPPESPSNLRVVAASYDFLTLAWDEGFTGGYPNTTYYIKGLEGTAGTPRDFDCHMMNPCNITALQQQTVYRLRVLAYNKKGQSPPSEELATSSQIDLARLPDPQQVKFEPKSRHLRFHVINTPLSIVGKIDVRAGGGGWRNYMDNLEVENNRGALEVDERVGEVDEVRVRLCLHGNTSICGGTVLAEFVHSLPTLAPTGLPMHYTIIIIVASVILVAILCLVFVCCCCRSRGKKAKKDYEMEGSAVRPNIVSQQPPPPYYSVGVENKGVERGVDGADDPAKVMYGQTGNNYGYHGVPNGHMPNGAVNMAYMDNSYSNSNSNNGGSVNSQDSLWQVKAGGNGGVPLDDRSYQYDPITHGGYGGYEDYAHYPPQDDYVMQRGPRDYNQDPYAPVHKPKRHHDHMDASGYGDVSGLPDPYMEHEGDEHKPPQLSFDESLESGYSTPRNRRVIREIIV